MKSIFVQMESKILFYMVYTVDQNMLIVYGVLKTRCILFMFFAHKYLIKTLYSC